MKNTTAVFMDLDDVQAARVVAQGEQDTQAMLETKRLESIRQWLEGAITFVEMVSWLYGSITGEEMAYHLDWEEQLEKEFGSPGFMSEVDDLIFDNQ